MYYIKYSNEPLNSIHTYKQRSIHHQNQLAMATPQEVYTALLFNSQAVCRYALSLAPESPKTYRSEALTPGEGGGGSATATTTDRTTTAKKTRVREGPHQRGI